MSLIIACPGEILITMELTVYVLHQQMTLSKNSYV